MCTTPHTYSLSIWRVRQEDYRSSGLAWTHSESESNLGNMTTYFKITTITKKTNWEDEFVEMHRCYLYIYTIIWVHTQMQMYLNNTLLTYPPLPTPMASSSMSKDNRMLTLGFLVPQTHRTIFFERKFGSSVNSAANRANGSLAASVCMRWAHLPLSRSY